MKQNLGLSFLLLLLFSFVLTLMRARGLSFLLTKTDKLLQGRQVGKDKVRRMLHIKAFLFFDLLFMANRDYHL